MLLKGSVTGECGVIRGGNVFAAISSGGATAPRGKDFRTVFVDVGLSSSLERGTNGFIPTNVAATQDRKLNTRVLEYGLRHEKSRLSHKRRGEKWFSLAVGRNDVVYVSAGV